MLLDRARSRGPHRRLRLGRRREDRRAEGLLDREEQLGRDLGRQGLHQDGTQQGEPLWRRLVRQLSSRLNDEQERVGEQKRKNYTDACRRCFVYTH